MSSTYVPPAWCSKLPRTQYSSLERIPIPSQTWFQVYGIRPNVFALYEPYHWEETISYLVIGTKHSLLIDTGMGIGNIRQVIDALIPSRTSLKIINTHTHHDHIGDNWQFQGNILGVRSAFAECNARGSIDEAQNELQPEMIWETYLPEEFNRQTYRIHPFEIDEYVQEGDRIELGNNHELRVIATPGHSPDSISLFDEKQRLLFAGDAFYQGPILLYRPETNLEDYYRSLEKLSQLCEKVDLVLPGHNVPNVQPKLLIKATQAMREILQGKTIVKATNKDKHDEYSFDEFSFVIDPSFLSK
jgi:glyoxylase-like metal-dependent hydrolase (beta-lactamase superfamily II)